MLYIAILLFAIAAIFGLVILKNWLTSAHTSRTVVYAHGAFAAVALVLLVVLVMRDPTSNLRTGLVLFGVAAIGGFYMFFRDLKGRFSPVWLAVTHALLAVGGLIFLLLIIL